jgi:hypothetical protein
LTRRCFFVSVIEHTSEQQDRCFRPRSTRNADPGWEHLESIECERLGTCTSPLLRKARPLPAVTGAMPRFLSSDERAPGDTAQTSHATPLVIVLWGRRARRRSPTCHQYHCTIEGPSCNALSAKRNAHRRPEAPSVESSKLVSGFDWRRALPKEVDSKKRFHSTDQRMPFVTANDRQSDATDDPAARMVRTSALHRSQHLFRCPDCSVAPVSVQLPIARK